MSSGPADVEAQFDAVTVAIDGRTVLHELSLDLPGAGIVGLVGPNGSGKSTALRCAYRALRPDRGAVRIAGQELEALSRRRSAQLVGAVPQDTASELNFTVEEVVALGRAPHLRGNEPLGQRDRALCRDAMERLDVLHLADRGILELSGGERQRAVIARALVQEPRVLVLDEPTNHLDIRHQIELLSLLREARLSVLLVLHDLNLAASTCDRLGVLADGGLVASGTPEEVLTSALVRDVFGVQASVVAHPLTGKPQLIYDVETKGAEPHD